MTPEEKTQSRKNIINMLKAAKKQAYYSLTCREHDALAALIDYMEMKGKELNPKAEA